jgi:hypothetical protein
MPTRIARGTGGLVSMIEEVARIAQGVTAMARPRYRQIHRGVDTGPGDRWADRLFPYHDRPHVPERGVDRGGWRRDGPSYEVTSFPLPPLEKGPLPLPR